MGRAHVQPRNLKAREQLSKPPVLTFATWTYKTAVAYIVLLLISAKLAAYQ